MPLCESLMNEWHRHFCHPWSLTVLSYCSPVSEGLAPADKLGTVQKRRVTFPTTTSTGQAITFLSLFVWLNQKLTKLNSKMTSASLDQQNILKPWLLNANPSFSHEYKGKINYKKS